MIDTVKIRFDIAPTPGQLRSWNSEITTYPDGNKREEYSNFVKLPGAVVRFLHYPQNPKYKVYLAIEASLPKVLYGNNIVMFTSTDEILATADKLNDLITGLDWMPEVDVTQGILTRVDFTYNHQVGGLVKDYIRALYNLTMPHRTTSLYKPEGVQFYSRYILTKFYDKEVESHNSSAAGILRHESEYRKPSLVAHELGISEPTLIDISKEAVVRSLQKDLQILRLDRTVITDSNSALAMLMKVYPPPKAITLYGYLNARKYATRDEMLNKGWKLRTMQSYEHDIAEAGVSMTMVEQTELPELKVDFGANIRAKDIVKLEEEDSHE